MTVYVSRYAATGELSRDLTDRDQSVERPVADLPLLTHVWRIVFEQQARSATADDRQRGKPGGTGPGNTDGTSAAASVLAVPPAAGAGRGPWRRAGR
ncbi:hypothetical protein E1165_14770 [Micromonospora sp. KC723]|nr:hypothetical protein E1165_14770 [Micromonospora sp. KC723]